MTRGDAYVSLNSKTRRTKGGGGRHVTTNKNNNSTRLKHLAEAGEELKRHTTTRQLYFRNNFEIYKKKMIKSQKGPCQIKHKQHKNRQHVGSGVGDGPVGDKPTNQRWGDRRNSREILRASDDSCQTLKTRRLSIGSLTKDSRN